MTNSNAPVLVVGASGTLGRQLLADMPNAIGTTRSDRERNLKMEITDEDQVRRVIGDVLPSCVINTAAMTSVDGCERDPATARKVHVDGTRHLVGACEAHGARFIHLSTNYVFDGAAGPYREHDSTNPLSVYGRSKLESEPLVLSSSSPGIVVRTAVFYGDEIDRPNFLTWALRELVSGKRIRIVTDEWANPTYVPELSAALTALASPTFQQGGLFHMAGAEFMTRYEMVIGLCDVFGLDQDLVAPVVSRDLQQAAARPARAGLRTDNIQGAAGVTLRPYRVNLSELRDRIGDLDVWMETSLS
jgi:dTDP-4-dehydrorhamnose reductase